MPVYVFQCEDGHRFDRLLKLKDYKEPQTCECGKSAKMKIVPTMIAPDMQESYVSPATGRTITSYKQRREDMKRSGCVDYEPSLRTNSKKVVEESEAKLEKAVDETVEKTISEMPADKREKLYNEMKHSDIQYERI